VVSNGTTVQEIAGSGEFLFLLFMHIAQQSYAIEVHYQ